MASVAEVKKRWGARFEKESWWEMFLDLYEGPGLDWEGAGAALDEMVFALAQAKGMDVAQTCPCCKKVAYEATTFSYCHHCAECEAAVEAADREAQENRQMEQARAETIRNFELSLLSPEERAARLAEEERVFAATINGLIIRDVQ